MGILDDYFDGYYSEEMIESQVDQLVFDELVRERFPKLGLSLILFIVFYDIYFLSYTLCCILSFICFLGS